MPPQPEIPRLNDLAMAIVDHLARPSAISPPVARWEVVGVEPLTLEPAAAAAYLERMPECAGMVALPWSDAWRVWAGEVETLLHDCAPALEAHARKALASAVEARAVRETGARRAS